VRWARDFDGVFVKIGVDVPIGMAAGAHASSLGRSVSAPRQAQILSVTRT
jgi:hypothetical protein